MKPTSLTEAFCPDPGIEYLEDVLFRQRLYFARYHVKDGQLLLHTGSDILTYERKTR